MGLFYNYKKSGKGISKQGPQKRAFFAFMEIFTGKFWKLLVLNLLYAAFCIPIVTFGPATAALTHVMRKFVLGQPIFVFHEFWTAFKKNFRQSFIMGLLDLVFIALCLYIIPFYDALLRTNLTTENTVLIIVTLSFIMYYIIMHFYIYLQIVALNLSLSAIIKNSIMLTVLGIKRNFINLLFILGFAFLFISVFRIPFWFYRLSLPPGCALLMLLFAIPSSKNTSSFRIMNPEEKRILKYRIGP